MDRISIANRTKEFLQKYKYTLLILGIGILLMSVPEVADTKTQENAVIPQAEPMSASKELETILTQISGVGKVKVMLTEAAGKETIYQTDDDQSKSNDTENIRVETVIITNSSREEQGLIRTIIPPVYLGAIIVCQGGDNPSVKLSVVQAVSSVTGISSERIIVLKMK